MASLVSLSWDDWGGGGDGWIGLVRNKANLSLTKASQLGPSLAIFSKLYCYTIDVHLNEQKFSEYVNILQQKNTGLVVTKVI